MLYEHTGRLDRAVAEYEHALEISPDDLTVMRNLARAYVKTDRKDEKVETLLKRILNTPGDKEWDSWTRGQLIRVGRPDSAAPPF